MNYFKGLLVASSVSVVLAACTSKPEYDVAFLKDLATQFKQPESEMLQKFKIEASFLHVTINQAMWSKCNMMATNHRTNGHHTPYPVDCSRVADK